MFRELVHIFGELVQIFSGTISFEKCGVIMATGGLQ